MKFTNDDLDGAMADLAMLRFFPSEAATRGSIKAYIAKICPHKAALDYVVGALVDRVGEWVGPAGMRRILAERYRPADGDKSPVIAEDGFIDWTAFPSHEDERALPPAEVKLLSAAASTELATIPDRPSEAIFGEVLAHFDKPWPRGTPKSSGEIRKLEEQLARDMATAEPLSEAEKQSRLLQIEAALGIQAVRCGGA